MKKCRKISWFQKTDFFFRNFEPLLAFPTYSFQWLQVRYRLTIVVYLCNAGINFIHNHPARGTTWKEQKPSLPGQSLCTKTLPSGQNRESKAPPPGHKVREFYKYIYELLTLFEMKSFVDSNERVFQWGDWLSKYISFGGHQSQTIERIKSFIWHV